jgi:hypothetical protein
MRVFALGYLVAASALAQVAPEPAASLDALLRDVWAQGADKAYSLYMGKSEVPMAPEARKAFPQRILELAKTPNVAGIILQGDKMIGYRRTQLPDAKDVENTYFVHFVREGGDPNKITERIYIDVHPDHALDVMEFIVRELLRPAAEREIIEAKVAGPSGLQDRADSILIYTATLSDVDWALSRLSEYQSAHRGHFLDKLPAGTRPRLIGVSTAAQPAASLKADSFGSYLAGTAQAAMQQQPPPADFAEFRKRVRERMKADGVDPDHPDRLTHRP